MSSSALHSHLYFRSFSGPQSPPPPTTKLAYSTASTPSPPPSAGPRNIRRPRPLSAFTSASESSGQRQRLSSSLGRASAAAANGSLRGERAWDDDDGSWLLLGASTESGGPETTTSEGSSSSDEEGEDDAAALTAARSLELDGFPLAEASALDVPKAASLEQRRASRVLPVSLSEPPRPQRSSPTQFTPLLSSSQSRPSPPPSSTPSTRSHHHHHRRRLPLPTKIHVTSIELGVGLVRARRRAGETLLLLAALCLACWRISREDIGESVLALECLAIAVAALCFLAWEISRTTPNLAPAESVLPASAQSQAGSAASSAGTPRRQQSLEVVAASSDEHLIWCTELRDYRPSPDSGLLTALLLLPVLAAGCLYSAHITYSAHPSTAHPPKWYIEPPKVHPPSSSSRDGEEMAELALLSLIKARRNLVALANLMSAIVLIHVLACKRKLARDENWVPKGEGKRLGSFLLLAALTTTGLTVFASVTRMVGKAVLGDLEVFEIIVSSLFFQTALYVISRLARKGFTLGELAVTAGFGTALFMETFNLTRAHALPRLTPYIKTFRLPTPLLIFQLALIPGSFLTGFLLSPLLVLSRNLSQKPIHRLRWPEQKQLHRRALAAGFYTGTALVVCGIIGPWTAWFLRWRNPFTWVLSWLLLGRTWWIRPALVLFWAGLVAVSVLGWIRQIGRVRKHIKPKPRLNSSIIADSQPASESAASGSSSPNNSSTRLSASASPVAGPLPLPTTSTTAEIMERLVDAADRTAPTMSLNARRKFFHALVVLMFIPGILLDPAFTHLAMSAAFALFIFAEYLRYFALYPVGAAIHLFLSEFTDSKDCGTAILSHFYLLTGCATSVWLEGSSSILALTGVLVLGVGDALASIVGKRYGRYRWSGESGKTLEGSAAFALSIFLCALGLRALGLVDQFSAPKYAIASAGAALLEALSFQNDNLTIPLFMWSVLACLNV